MERAARVEVRRVEPAHVEVARVESAHLELTHISWRRRPHIREWHLGAGRHWPVAQPVRKPVTHASD